jgi:hypothetical protein
MEPYQLPPRKPDLLDALTELRYKRRIAYTSNNTQLLAQIHLEIKAFRLKSGWDEQDAEEEYLQNVNECKTLFTTQEGNINMRYCILNRDRQIVKHNLSIGELSLLWLGVNQNHKQKII